MKTVPPAVTDHSLARLTRWARLWLNWFVWAFFACVPILDPGRQHARRALDDVSRLVRSVLITHAARRQRMRVAHLRPRFGRARLPNLRVAAGARLRHALSGKTAFARLAAIHAILSDPSAHIAALAARLRNGLTRLRPIIAAPTSAPSAPHFSCAPRPADTS